MIGIITLERLSLSQSLKPVKKIRDFYSRPVGFSGRVTGLYYLTPMEVTTAGFPILVLK
jgi:hypothetical protein